MNMHLRKPETSSGSLPAAEYSLFIVLYKNTDYILLSYVAIEE
jgi:hypothetical protein